MALNDFISLLLKELWLILYMCVCVCVVCLANDSKVN